MTLKLRKNFVPRSLADAAALSFVVTMIPVTYCLELFLVLPSFYEPWSAWYTLHATLGALLALSAGTNLVAAVMVDTSVGGEVLQPPAAAGAGSSGWRFCPTCESHAPPRSWHCDTCATCILKRDHHCVFTGCCVGHRNQRFFLLFLLSLCLGSTYASYFNCWYLWRHVELASLLAVARLLFPLAVLVVGAGESPARQLAVLVALVNLAGAVFTWALLVFHARLVLKGAVTYEHNHGHGRRYDYGPARNLREVFGERWRLVWISPLVASRLPQDGIHWEKPPADTLRQHKDR